MEINGEVRGAITPLGLRLTSQKLHSHPAIIRFQRGFFHTNFHNQGAPDGTHVNADTAKIDTFLQQGGLGFLLQQLVRIICYKRKFFLYFKVYFLLRIGGCSPALITCLVLKKVVLAEK